MSIFPIGYVMICISPFLHVSARAFRTGWAADRYKPETMTVAIRAKMPYSKRLMDLVLSSAGLVLLWPVLLLAAAAIKLSSPGPVFYVAKRAGLDGMLFGLLKFRTMHCGADRFGPCTAKHDARVFRAGRILRLLKIDELPQLINVLRGEMSLVGPRPEDWNIVREHYTAAQREVLKVRPGLTGIPQVCYFPEIFWVIDSQHTDPQEYYYRVILPLRVEMDLEYIRNQSFWFDLYLIVATVYLILFKSWWSGSRSIPISFGARATTHWHAPPTDSGADQGQSSVSST
jgi:lipopolysaccharide/colanic/teichoic acid biosynthesis glycosyltransferase